MEVARDRSTREIVLKYVYRIRLTDLLEIVPRYKHSLRKELRQLATEECPSKLVEPSYEYSMGLNGLAIAIYDYEE